ncbi:mannitol operon transcriptional antiterminator [Paenibacillus jamilae]|jgi:mannitol operon transcriptional antiterminator|uniref:Putative licABCH operon regulator n=1 Tax=Paenibacillus polymyxa TaxID=1406 RepID=A0A378Y448_PAEPO|nr:MULTISPECIES: PRD domain-containing protein [Paenibacillus]MDP9674097.1 mannitol operon transcriptional antiterminator [Paenibacillus jamilae]KAF6615559.1 BglG family transcription antiterminator [Paenibacillus sp. EKM101P]KAF6619925.1 BglG family transcription antiterminator [Paenibacillus sp. EKM102P]KAF6628494.1 BglG family transcription antiterminator [Paenibacillus sp. EKM10P]KAF6644484.1 BglG family transcription antiterminator [Paenibacillus sp. EKM11P]
MNITKRQSDIVEYLLEQPHEVTAGEIAEKINVSTRTVHRELGAVECWLAAHEVKLEKKSGIGIYVDADPNQLASLREQLLQTKSDDYSAEERKIVVLCMLLDTQEPIKLLALASDLKVTVTTVSHDLDELRGWIADRGLVLVRRRGYGVEITGREIDKRRAISELALEYLDESALFSGREELRPVTRVTEKLLEMMGRENLLTVENALWQPHDQWLKNMVESKYMELLIQICVSLARLRLGYVVDHRLSYSKTDSEENIMLRTAMVERICGELSAALDIEFPESERCYFGLLFRDAEDHSTRLLPLDDLVLLESVHELIRRVEAETGTPLAEDRVLREGLIAHMTPVFKRLREGRSIRNPLLQQIRKDYGSLFDSVKKAAADMTEMEVPDEEIGFLVMHFGASLERLRQLQREVRAIVVCTSGIGSSRLLATRLAKELPQIKIVDRASWYEATRIPKEDYDLIISTVELPLEPDRYLKISPLLTQEESDRLRHFIQHITLNQLNDHRQEQAVLPSQGMEWLTGLRKSLEEIVHIVQQFQVYPLENQGMDMSATIEAICMLEAVRGNVTEPSVVAEQLVERERQGSQVISDTSVALIHTRSPYVRQPSLTLYRLAEPLLADVDEQVECVLLMLGPRELPKESLEVLSEISALLLQEDMITLLEHGSRDQIANYISSELAEFFHSKLGTGRNLT